MDLTKSNNKPREIEIPSDILHNEILTWLPIKSLMRFKIVNKSWLSLIHHPSFVKQHHSRQSRNYTNLFLTAKNYHGQGNHLFSVQIDPQGVPKEPIHLFTLKAGAGRFSPLATHSVKGLVLINIEGLKFCTLPLYIVNPSTREVFTLPKADDQGFPTYSRNVDIYTIPANYKQHLRFCKGYKQDQGFHYTSNHTPERDIIVHRLGFSEVTNEYKVFRVRQMGKCTNAFDYSNFHEFHKLDRSKGPYCKMFFKMKFDIFNLTTKSWKKIKFDRIHLPFHPTTFDMDFSTASVSLRGGIHWMYKDENLIVVFDVGDEVFREIPLPISLINDPNHWNIIQVCGCIAICNERTPIMTLWILKDYQSYEADSWEDYDNSDSWISHDIDISSLCLELSSPHLYHSATIDAGNCLMVSDSDGGFRLYNMETKMWGLKQKFRLTDPKSIVLTSYAEIIQVIQPTK